MKHLLGSEDLPPAASFVDKLDSMGNTLADEVKENNQTTNSELRNAKLNSTKAGSDMNQTEMDMTT